MSRYHDAGSQGRRTTLYRTTFATYAVLAVVGLAGLMYRLPFYDVISLTAAAGGPALVLSLGYRIPGLSSGFVFTWIAGILFGAMGISAFVMLA